MERSIELQECAFGNFDRNLHFDGDTGFLLGGKFSLCAPSFLICTPDALLPTPGKFGISPSGAQHPNSSAFFSSILTSPP